jgi:hypothetical protein
VCYSPFTGVMTVDRVAMTTLQVLQEKGKRSMCPLCADTSRRFRRIVVERPKYSDQVFTRFQANQSFPENYPLRWDIRVYSRGKHARRLAGLSFQVPWRTAEAFRRFKSGGRLGRLPARGIWTRKRLMACRSGLRRCARPCRTLEPRSLGDSQRTTRAGCFGFHRLDGGSVVRSPTSRGDFRPTDP